MRVRVYRNLHNGLFSIQHKRKVIGYARDLFLSDVKFVVSQAGRKRVLKEKRKNVHAFVEGEIDLAIEALSLCPEEAYTNPVLHRKALKGQFVSYNPYKAPTFVHMDLTHVPIRKADLVILTIQDGHSVVSLPRV